MCWFFWPTIKEIAGLTEVIIRVPDSNLYANTLIVLFLIFQVDYRMFQLNGQK